MNHGREYEVVIVGAGPAGLSAARTAARLGFRTLVLERLSAPGESSHPCSGVIAPVPGFVTAQRRDDGLYFPELDLQVPSALVTGFSPSRRFTSPGGYEFQVGDSQPEDIPVAVLDRPGLLRMLTEQATAAGAESCFGTGVLGVIHEGDRIAGVRTAGGEIRSQIVLSAEGAARGIAEQAGLYGKATPLSSRYAFVVSQEMEAPAVGPDDLGQIITLGKRFTSAPEGFGTVVLPTPGRASVYFTVFADRAAHLTVQSSWAYLDEYVEHDPRVYSLFKGARILSRSGYRMIVRAAPQKVVQNGLLGVGDSVTAGGHLGILSAMYVGRQAALYAAEAIDEGDTSVARLADYSGLFRGPILRGLDAESRVVMGLTGMTDDEIDRLCQTMQTLRMATPYFSNLRAIAWETLGWVLQQFPLIARDWELLRRMLGDGNEQPAEIGAGAGPEARLALLKPEPVPAPLRIRLLS